MYLLTPDEPSTHEHSPHQRPSKPSTETASTTSKSPSSPRTLTSPNPQLSLNTSNPITPHSIRYSKEFDDYLLLSTSSRSPFLTLWTASWCSSCKVVAPIVKEIIEDQHVGEDKGGVAYAEVEFDSPTVGPLARRYAITGIPTLLAFHKGEASLETRLTDVNEMKDPEMLRLWIMQEALRGLGSPGLGYFGTMFKVPEKR